MKQLRFATFWLTCITLYKHLLYLCVKKMDIRLYPTFLSWEFGRPSWLLRRYSWGIALLEYIYIYADTLIYLNIKILKKIIELHFVIKNENQPVARRALYASVQYVDTVEYAHASIHTWQMFIIKQKMKEAAKRLKGSYMKLFRLSSSRSVMISVSKRLKRGREFADLNAQVWKDWR